MPKGYKLNGPSVQRLRDGLSKLDVLTKGTPVPVRMKTREIGAGLPPGGVKYQVIMRIDDAGTAGWDYPRIH